MVDQPLKSGHIAIIGFGQNSQPPERVWADDGIEKWTLNHGHVLDARWDRLFEFHGAGTIDLESALHTRGVSQLDALRSEQRRPIYMREARADVPASVRFDIERWVMYFGRYCEKLQRKPYCVMAVGFMIGEAIIRLMDTTDNVRFGRNLGASRISLYGIEMTDDEEWAHQRACCEFLLGWAQGMGIPVSVPDASAVFASTGLYEYDSGEVTEVLNWQLAHLAQRSDKAKDLYVKARKDNDDAVARMQTFSAQMQEIEAEQAIVKHLLRGGRYE